MKPITELVREHGTEDSTRKREVQLSVQFRCQFELADWLRGMGVELEPFDWRKHE